MIRIFAALGLALGLLTSAGAVGAEAPYLRSQGDTRQLIVDGEPFLMRGGELGNSSAADLTYLAPHWKRFQALNMNTVLAPVYWELIEPQEGKFDFSLVDGLIRDARAHDIRLVLLWFGSWKNSMSSYAPAWVKRDQARFPRAERSTGTGMEILSPFARANWEADAKAFAALMKHLGRTDRRNTVVMVQVENEIGMIPEARDHSAVAEAAYNAPVPEALIAYLNDHSDTLHPRLKAAWRAGRTGSWEEVFGKGIETEEFFSAWFFARYVEHVSKAGLAHHDIPLYVNAALARPGHKPGEYPSAGPLPHLIDIWRAGAPSLDFLAPDIYFENFVHWVSQYDVPGNPVFIPEANRAGRTQAVGDLFYAFGGLDAMGFSPFSIESIAEPATHPLSDAYEVLEELSPLIAAHQGKGSMIGYRPEIAYEGTLDDKPKTFRLGGYEMTITPVDPWTPRDAQDMASHGGLIIHLSEDEFLVAGQGITLTFPPAEDGKLITGIESAWEGRFKDGKWAPGRALNGDQTHQGRHIRLPPGKVDIQRFRLYRYR